MMYALMLAVLWAAVGALVFFVRTSMSLPRRLGLTVGTSLVFGVVGWVDISSIVRADPAFTARGSVRPDMPRLRKQEPGSLTMRGFVGVATDNRQHGAERLIVRECIQGGPQFSEELREILAHTAG